MSGVTLVFLAVVAARFLIPLLIPRWPLPAIVAALVLDGVDQTIFQLFGYDPPGYQGYDKAMDVYYLAIAYLATLRNWASPSAFRIGQFLYFYRLVGVVAFELTHARALLLVFPNTFEYFFIAYEAVRSRWDPLSFVRRWWLVMAAAIWVGIKLPQETWLHIAQLDVTDTMAAHRWVLPVLVLVVLAALAAARLLVVPRLRRPDWGWRWQADPLPHEIDEAAEQAAWRAEHGRTWSWVTLEKVTLMSLLAVIFSQTIPGVRLSDSQLAVGVGLIVVVNAAITLALARRAMTIASLGVTFAVRTVANVVLVGVAEAVLRQVRGDVDTGHTLFFLMLISLITTLHDRWEPVRSYRLATGTAVVR